MAWGKSEKPTAASDSASAAKVRALPAPIPQRALDYYVAGLVAESIGDIPSASMLYDSARHHCPQSVEISRSLAQSMVQTGRIAEAVDILLTIPVPDVATLTLTAYCLKQLDQPDLAREMYLKIVALDSTQGAPYMYLASYYEQRQKPDSAMWALRNLARTMPDNYQVANELGKAFLAYKDQARAKDAFRRSLELMPAASNMEALLNLADIFDRSQQPDSIIDLFVTSLRASPDNAFLHRELSRLFLARDSVTQALPHLREAARLEPNDFAVRRRLAIVLLAADSLDAAESILTRLVEEGDAEPADHFYLGRIAAMKQSYERARSEFEIVTERAPSIPDAWLSLGFVLRRLGYPIMEIETYQKGLLAMTEEEYAVQLYFALGAAFEQNKMDDSAIATFETLLQHQPDHGPTLNYLGYTLADHGIRLEYARDLIARAVKLEPKNAAYLDSYGWVYYQMGEFKDAVKYLKMAVELDSDPVIYDHLGDAYMAIGKNKQAREWWQKALDRLPDNETIRQKLQQR